MYKFDWSDVESQYEAFLAGKVCRAKMGRLIFEDVYIDVPICDGIIRFDSPAVPYPKKGKDVDYPPIFDECNPETGLVELEGGEASICIEDFAKDAKHPAFEEFRVAAEKELISVYAKRYHVPECRDNG